jgi:hypothetical protein
MAKKLFVGFQEKKNVSSGLVYIYECGFCGRRFSKSKMDSTLKPHKDKEGNMCYGTGNFVESKPKKS